MSRPDYIIEAREVSNTITRQRTRATRLAMERAYNDGFAAGLERAAEIATTHDELDSAIWRNVTSVVATAIRAEKEKM